MVTINLADRVRSLNQFITVRDLKQRFYYNNMCMENDDLLADYGIEENAIIESTSNPLIVAFVYEQMGLHQEKEKEMKKTALGPVRTPPALIDVYSVIKAIFAKGSAIRYVGEDYERIKEYLKPCKVDFHRMQFQLQEYRLIDKVFGGDDPIGHFILRTTKRLQEPKSVLDKYQRMIDRMHNKDAYVDDDTEERDQPKTPVIGNDDTEDEDMCATQPDPKSNDIIVYRVYSDNSDLSSYTASQQTSETDSTAATQPLSTSSGSFIGTPASPSTAITTTLNHDIFMKNGSTVQTNNAEILRQLRYYEDENRKWIQTWPGSNLPMVQCAAISQNQEIPLTLQSPTPTPPMTTTTTTTTTTTGKRSADVLAPSIPLNTSTGSMDNQLLLSDPDPAIRPLKKTKSMSVTAALPKKKAASTAALGPKEYCPRYMSIPFSHIITLSMHSPLTVNTVNEYSQPFTYQDLISVEKGRDPILKYHSGLEDNDLLVYNESVDTLKNTPKGIVYGKIYRDFFNDKQEFNRLNACTPILSQREVIVVIDNREHNAKRVEKQLLEWGIKSVIRRIPSGDFLFLQRPGTGAEPSMTLMETNMYPFLIERKSFSDFESSIIDERWKTQRNRMLMSTVLRRKGLFYLVEGTEQAYRYGNQKAVPMETLSRLMDEMVCSSDFHLLRTTSQYDTIKHLAMFAKLLESEPDESRGLVRYSDFHQAVTHVDTSIDQGGNQEVRESITWNGDSFKEYVMNPQWRANAALGIRGNRTLKLLVLNGVTEYKKLVTSNVDKLLKEYWYIEYYLLHIQVVLGAKTYISPNLVALENLNKLVDKNDQLSEMFKIRINPDDKTSPLYKHKIAKAIEYIPHESHHRDIMFLRNATAVGGGHLALTQSTLGRSQSFTAPNNRTQPPVPVSPSKSLSQGSTTTTPIQLSPLQQHQPLNFSPVNNNNNNNYNNTQPTTQPNPTPIPPARNIENRNSMLNPIELD
eukprot:gene1472-1710_t